MRLEETVASGAELASQFGRKPDHEPYGYSPHFMSIAARRDTFDIDGVLQDPMVDRLSTEARSALMARIRPSDTKPELRVRSMLHQLGYRFRLHRRDLPGTPDIVLPRRKVAVFVHGCFWHGHVCKADKMPKSRTDYWGPKIAANRARDALKRHQLRALGWKVIWVWECELKSPGRLGRRLQRLIG